MKFSVGEIAIYQPQIGKIVPGIAGPGSECEIMEIGAIGPQTGKPGFRCLFSGDPQPAHPKGWWYVPFGSLRKKKYDGNEIVSWDECIWRPEHETI